MGDGFFMQVSSQQSFSIIALLLGFPWYFPEQSGKIMLFSIIFYPIFSGFYLLELFRWAIFELSNSYSFIYSYLYIRYLFGYSYSFIHSYTYWFSSLFLSCSAIRYICFLLLLFEQSSLVICYFIPSHCYKTFLLF